MVTTFDILGPLSVAEGDQKFPIKAPKVRIVLAYLLLQNNRAVPLDELVDVLWRDSPPRNARNALQTYVMRLRHALGDAGDVVRTESPGYLIAVADDAIDLGRFRTRVARSQAAAVRGDLHAAADELKLGLALWRGRPLADVPSEVLQNEQVPRLIEEQLQSVERRIELDLQLGRHRELVVELRDLTTRHPLREGLWSQLMLALYRSDRKAEALSAYRDLRTVLREELGADPCETVQRLHQQMLVSDASLDVPDRAAASGVSAEALSEKPPPPPFQVPADVPTFVGRAQLAERIQSLLDPPLPDRPAIPGVILSGPPGVGKTALAVHAAQRLHASFPDGQLYVDMRGYSHSNVMSSAAALTRFLRALGVASEKIPAEVDEMSSQFRSLLTDRRVLIVLDNVISADQVRPLLPGRPGSMVLVTSRDTLAGLTAINGMPRIPVEPASTDEATALLATILGTRVTDEPEASVDLAALCGNLPLALRIAAANLATRPDVSVASYVAQLRSEDTIGALAIDGDDEARVEGAFDLSYRALQPEVARMFRRLSLIPGPDFDRWAAANVADVSPPVAGRILARLAARNLIQHKRDRYQFHDLLHEYAYRKFLATEKDEARDIVGRLFAFYLSTTDAATRLLHPDLPRLALPTPPPQLLGPSVEGPAQAVEWLGAEVANLEAMVCATASATHALPVWLLADAMLGYVDQQRLDNSWRMVCSTGRDAAVRAGDRRAAATMCRHLGRLYYLQTRYDLSTEHYLQAQDTFREIGDQLGEARVLNGLSAVVGSSSNYREAIHHLSLALHSCHEAGNRTDEAETLTNLGTVLVLGGQAADGIRYLQSARTIAVQLKLDYINARAESAIALNDLYCGSIGDAELRFQGVLDRCREVRYRKMEAQTLRNLAEVQLESGNPQRAREFAEQALELARRIDAYWHVMGAHVTLGQAALALDDVRGAFEHFSCAYDPRASQVQFWYPFAMLGLGACRRLSGDGAVAVELLSQGVTDPRPRVRAQANLELAKAYLTLEDLSAGLVHAQQAYETARGSGYRLDADRALAVAAEIAAR